MMRGAFILAVLLAIPRVALATPPTIPDGYYYDLNTDKVFTFRIHDIPPISVPGAPTDAKPTGARAFIFACNDCNDPKDRYIGWVEFYTPAAIARLRESATQPTSTQATPTQPASM